MSKKDDQRQQLLQSDYTNKAGTTAGATQPIVYPKLDAEGSTPPAALSRDQKLDAEGSTTPAALSRDPKLDAEGSTPPAALNRDSASSEKDGRKWGTKVMGAPAAPSAHPQNQEAAMWTAPEEHPTPSSYIVQPTAVQNSKSPMNSVQHCFNKWTKKAENLASEVWTNLKTGNSMSDAAWGKLTLGAKALTEGGFEALFRHTFSVSADEKLRKTYACYLSTSTGPVAGTLYISTVKIAFCSDRPLSFTNPSGEDSWSYYRLAVPLANVKAVNPSTNKDNPAAKYIQIVTVDGHEFWMMGFVNYENAVNNLRESSTQSQLTHVPIS